jgi:hypothetical protein
MPKDFRPEQRVSRDAVLERVGLGRSPRGDAADSQRRRLPTDGLGFITSGEGLPAPLVITGWRD